MKRFLMFCFAGVASLHGWAAIQVAGSLLVNLDASSASGVGVEGRVGAWSNGGGALGGNFVATQGSGPVYRPLGGVPALWFQRDGGTVLVGPQTPSSLTGGNAWTVEVWIHRLDLPNQVQTFLSWTPRVADMWRQLMEARYSGDGGIAIEHWGDNVGWARGVPPANVWHHIVMTRDAVSGIERIYVDGLLNTEVGRPTNIAAGGDLVIGASWNGGKTGFDDQFSGYIAKMRIHAGTLRAGGVSQNYLEERAAFGRSSDPDFVWGAPSGLWTDPSSWFGNLAPGLSGSTVTMDNGGVAILEADAGALASFSPVHGGLTMRNGASLAVALNQTVRMGYGAGNHFSLDLSDGYFSLLGTDSGWLYIGVDGGAANATIGAGGGRAEVFANRDTQIGNSGFGEVSIGADGGLYSANGWIYIGLNATGTGIVTVAHGGEIACKNPGYQMNVLVGHNDGHGELVIRDGGAVRPWNELIFTSGGASANSYAEVRLEDGGIIEARRICGQNDVGTRLLYMDGGVIINRDSRGNFMENLTGAYIGEHGVTFDIIAGTQVWVPQALAADPGLQGPDGGIVKTGDGTLVLNGANTFNGPLDVRAGQLWLSGGGALPQDYGGAVTVAAGAAIGWAVPGGAAWLLAHLDRNTAGALVIFNENAAETLDLSQFPNLTLSTQGNFTFTGTYIPYGQVYRFAPQDGRLIYTAAIGGASSVVMDGRYGGSLELSGNNSYTGLTTVNGGWLVMGSANALGAGSIRLTDGGSVLMSAGGIPPGLAGRLTADSEGFLILGSNYSNYDVNLTGRPGVHLGTDQGTMNYVGTFTPAGSTYRAGGGRVSYWASDRQGLVLSGLSDSGGPSRNVVIQGEGLVRLMGNDHTGGTVITNRGALFLREDSGLGRVPAMPDPANVRVDGGVVRNGNAVFDVHENRGWHIGPGGAEFHPWGGNQMTIRGDLSGTGRIFTTDGGTVVFGGANNTWTGETELRNGATIQLGRDNILSWPRDNAIIGNGGWLAVFGDLSTGTRAWSSIFARPLGADVSPNVGLRKRGAGTLLLDVDQLYTWDTIIEAGILKIGSQNAIPNAPGRGNTGIDSTLDLNGFTTSLGGIYGGGAIVDSAGTVRSVSVGANNASTTFNGTVAPDITLTKTGTGNQSLNTYGVSNAHVAQGTLTTINPTAPTGLITLAGGATLAASGNGAPAYGEQGCLTARYYDIAPPTEQTFDSLAKINTFIATARHTLVTSSRSAGNTLDFSSTGSRFAPPYHEANRDNFAVALTGRFLAETAGNYTFGTQSDDGSIVVIDDTIAVNNNRLQGWGGSLMTATAALEAGWHTFTVLFWEAGGGQALTVYMVPPGQPVDLNDLPALPQSLLATEPLPSRWPALNAAGANVSLVQNGAAEIATDADATLSGCALTSTAGTALIKSGTGRQTFETARMDMRGTLVVREGEVAFGANGGTLTAVEISEGATVSTASKMSGLVGKYYNIWPSGGSAVFNDLATYEAYLAPYQPALVASSLLAGERFDFAGNGSRFPPPYNVGFEGFQVLWKGFILIPAADTYTFYTASDDGSMLFIDGAAVVNNNYSQGVTERGGTIALTAGWHDIAISYYQGGGGYGFYARIEGGGLPKQEIPNAMLSPIGAGLGSWLGNGLTVEGPLTGQGTLALDGENTAVNLKATGDYTLGTRLAGAASTMLLKTGPGTLTFSGDASAFLGTWHVFEGELRLADGTSIGAPGAEISLAAGTVLSLEGDAAALGRITGNGIIRLNGGTPTLGDLAAFTGTIETAPGQSLALLGSSMPLDAARFGGIDHLTLLDGIEMYYFDPAELPATLTSSNALIVLNVTGANKDAWALDRLTVMAGATQQVTACTSGLYGRYYYTPRPNGQQEEDAVKEAVKAAFESVEGAEAYFAQQAPGPVVSSWTYGSGLSCGDTRHPALSTYEWFGVIWKGKIRITAPGTYTFGTRSDDNSMLFIDGRPIVYSNFNQGPTTRTGAIALTQGLHDIAILFYQGNGGHWMEAYIQRPGDPDLIVLPNDMLVADLAETAAYAAPIPYTLTAATVAVENPGRGTAEMRMAGTLAFSGLWIDTGAVLEVIGAARVAGPLLSMTIPRELPPAGNLVLVGDFTQAGGLNLNGVALQQPITGSHDARIVYRYSCLYLSRKRGTVIILR